jgi:hypothetical protein
LRLHPPILGLAVAALLSLSPHDADAQQNLWLRDGAPAGAAPSRAAVGDFAVMQIATPDPDGLMAAWNKPTAGVNITTAHEIARNQPIVTFILFQGCARDSAGTCNVTADFETLDPTGKVYDLSRNVAIWVGHPPPPAGSLQLSEGALGLRIENKDPLGAYRIRVTITDHVSGNVLHTQDSVRATAN